MKRIVVFCLCAVLVLTAFSACTPVVQVQEETLFQQATRPTQPPQPTQATQPTLPPQPTQETGPTQETQTTQKTEDSDSMKLLIIGNSHSIDAFYLLYEAFRDQQPDQELVLGILHYSGCSISKHVAFAHHDKDVYTYFRNTNGQWEIYEQMDMIAVLKDQSWNMVMFQAAKTDLNETLNERGRRNLEQFVTKYIPADHQFLWHTSWPSPNDEAFFAPDYVRPAPEGYKENLMNLYGFDPVKQFTVLTDMAKTHILPDDHYSKAICTGAAVMYAHLTMGVRQIRLWRDYTHLSDYGRLIAAYAMYAQLTGNEVHQIGISTVPVTLRHYQYQHIGDMVVTEHMKKVIMQAANSALEDPWSVPGQK